MNLTLDEIKKLQLKTNWGGSTNFQVPTLEEFIQIAKGKVCLYLDKAGYDLPEHEEGHLVKELLKIGAPISVSIFLELIWYNFKKMRIGHTRREGRLLIWIF